MSSTSESRKILRVFRTLLIAGLLVATLIGSLGFGFQDADKHRDPGKILLCITVLLMEMQIQSLLSRADKNDKSDKSEENESEQKYSEQK